MALIYTKWATKRAFLVSKALQRNSIRIQLVSNQEGTCLRPQGTMTILWDREHICTPNAQPGSGIPFSPSIPCPQYDNFNDNLQIKCYRSGQQFANRVNKSMKPPCMMTVLSGMGWIRTPNKPTGHYSPVSLNIPCPQSFANIKYQNERFFL